MLASPAKDNIRRCIVPTPPLAFSFLLPSHPRRARSPSRPIAPPHTQPTINPRSQHPHPLGPRIPRITRLPQRSLADRPTTEQIRLPRHHIRQEAQTRVPREMAVQGPDAGVVLAPLQHEIAGDQGGARRHDEDVAALRVGGADDGTVPFAEADGEHLRVVAVEVHGVGGVVVVVDDSADGGGVARVPCVAGGGGGGRVVGQGVGEERVVEVDVEGVGAQVEQHVRAVGLHADLELFRERVGRRGEGEGGHGEGEGVVAAGGQGCGGGGADVGERARQGLVVAALVVDDAQGFGEEAVVQTAPNHVGAHPVAVALSAGAVDDHVGALADPERDHAGLVGDDGHEVVGDDVHVVAVDGELLDGRRARVDETEPMELARCEIELGIVGRRAIEKRLHTGEAHLAVDEVGVGQGELGTALGERLHKAAHVGHVRLAVPLLEHDGAWWGMGVSGGYGYARRKG